MSSIPLPALAVKPPEQPDMMGNLSKLMAMKQMMGQQQLQQQEIQLRQQQVHDQNATTAALKSVDPSDPKYKANPNQYYSDVQQSVLKNGGSATAAMGIQQHALTVQKTVSDIASADAATGSKNLETFNAKHKAVGEALEPLADPKVVPDAQLHDKAMQTVASLAQSGVLDQQTAQQSLQHIQATQDPTQLRAVIDQIAKTSMGAANVAELAKTQAAAAKDQAETNEKNQASQFYQNNPGVGAPGVPAESSQMAAWLRANPGKTAADFKPSQAAATARAEMPVQVAKDVAVARATQPLKIQTAIAEGQARANIQNGGLGSYSVPAGATGEEALSKLDPATAAVVKSIGDGKQDFATMASRMSPVAKVNLSALVKAYNPDFNQATYSIEKGVQKDFTTGPDAQKLQAFNTAITHMGVFRQTAEALDNNDIQSLNKLGNVVGTQFGSDKVTNFNIAKQAFIGEVGRAFDGAGVTQGDRNKIEENANAAQSPAQLKGVADTAEKLLRGKREVLKQQYDQGSKGQPNFGDNTSSGASTNQGGSNFFSSFGGKPRQ